VISAPAKFILLGEHSVVFKGRALAFALPDLRLSIEATSLPSSLNGEALGGEALNLFKCLLGRFGVNQNFLITSKIPIGAGLGSSAALSFALAQFVEGSDEPAAQLALKALDGERVFHARPSGVDVHTIAHGLPIVFSPDDAHKNFNVQPLDLDFFAKHHLKVAVFNTGEAHSTKRVQESVSDLRLRSPIIFEEIIDQLSANADAGLRILQKAAQGQKTEANHLGHLMRDTQVRLRHLGVSTEKIEELVTNLESLDTCHGAKLTGAGCGGCVIGLFDQSENFERLKARPLSVWTHPQSASID
jgi:mevalonate kinase